MEEKRRATILEWKEVLNDLSEDIFEAESNMDEDAIDKAYKAYFRIMDLCPYTMSELRNTAAV